MNSFYEYRFLFVSTELVFEEAVRFSLYVRVNETGVVLFNRQETKV